MLRFGLIGAGRWGSRYIHTINQIPDIKLAHIASSKEDVKNLVIGGCLVSQEWQALIGNSELDGIIIATPPSSHFDISMQAIGAKVPILIEKPLTLNLREAKEIKRFSSEQKVFTMVGHTHLYSEAFRKLKTTGKELGRLLSVSSGGGAWGPFRIDTSMLWDWAPHDISMCLDLFEEYPSLISCKTNRVIKTQKFYGEEKEVGLFFPGGGDAKIVVSNINKIKTRIFKAVYEGGTLIYDDQSNNKLQLLECSKAFSKIKNISLTGVLPLENLVREFAQGIMLKKNSDHGIDIGLDVVKILDICGEPGIS